MATAAVLAFVFVLGFLLGYVVREIISQRRQRRALLHPYGVNDLQPAQRLAPPNLTSPPLAPKYPNRRR